VSELVHLDVDRHMAVVTLDSPENRNALSEPLVEQLARCLALADADPDVRAVIITATGTVFCSGADLKAGGRAAVTSFPSVLAAVLESSKPVIAKLNGRARAGGIGLIAACDVAVAPDTADFAFSEVRIGLAPAIIAVTCARCMTPRSLSRYMLTGQVFSAAEAAADGLLTISVPAGEVDGAVEDLADALRQCSPAALGVTKRLLSDVRTLGVADGFERMARVSAEMFASDDGGEGMRAFAERRPPRWAV
jgi:methylglutaconyl-CoA hydratase